MKAFVIYNSCYRDVARQARRCLASFSRHAGWEAELFDGCHPGSLRDYEAEHGVHDGRAKIGSRDPRYMSKKSCFYSHFAMWLYAIRRGPIVVVEYDTVCIADWAITPPDAGVVHLSLQSFATNRKNKYVVNWPGEADRLAAQPAGIHDIAGTLRGQAKRDMPGNTAYLITQSSARILVDDCRRHGWQQNDVLMTRDRVPLLYAVPSPIAYLEHADRHTSHRTFTQC